MMSNHIILPPLCNIAKDQVFQYAVFGFAGFPVIGSVRGASGCYSVHLPYCYHNFSNYSSLISVSKWVRVVSSCLGGKWVKKKDIVDLIRYYVDGNDSGFRELAYDIANEFNKTGDRQLGGYILTLLSSKSLSFEPQAIGFSSDFFRRLEVSSTYLGIPNSIMNDINGIINAINYNSGINKFLFSGPPGTGKTETAKHLARILNRQLYSVSFENIIDSHLGQTSKNIMQVFDEINRQSFPESLIILVDEIDSLAMDRINSRDLREMGRATTSFMRGLDDISPDVILIATTNVIDSFDKAMLRRFDKVVDFSRYSNDDLSDIAINILSNELKKFGLNSVNQKVCNHIFKVVNNLPYPGDLKNLIRTAIAFSNPSDPNEYIRNIYNELLPQKELNMADLKSLGFSLREMEVILGVSRSKIFRQLSE